PNCQPDADFCSFFAFVIEIIVRIPRVVGFIREVCPAAPLFLWYASAPPTPVVFSYSLPRVEPAVNASSS
ncbi:unnamed protein product, partial [Amoebophrya sp. A25]